MCAFSYSTNCKEVNHDKSFINDSLQTFPGLILFSCPGFVCHFLIFIHKWNGTWANIFVPYPMRYLPSHLMTCGSKVQRSNNYTPRQIYPTCSALWGCQIYIPDAATRLAQRSSLLVVFTRHWSAMISAAAWRYGKQIFSLANTTPISLKSDYQIWMTLLKKAGWRKPAVSICTASVAQLAWLHRWR